MTSKFKIANISYIYLIWVILRNGLIDTERNTFYVASLLSKIGIYIEPLLTLVMLIVAIIHYRIKREYLGLYIICILMTIVYLFSLFLNGPLNLMNAIMFFWGYFAYIPLLLFTLAYNNFEKVDFKFFLRFFCIFIISEFLINFSWYLGISPLKNDILYWDNSLDWAYGTLMGCVESSGISSIFIFFSLYLILYKPTIKYRKILMFLFWIIGGLQIIWADSKLSYLSFMLSSIIFVFAMYRKKLIYKIGILIVAAIFMFGIFYLSMLYNEIKDPSYGGANNRFIITVTEAYNYLIYGNPKVCVYNKIMSKELNVFPYNLFGRGPGNFTSRFAQKNPSEYTIKYWLPEYEKAQAITNSVMFNPQTAFLSILGDTGWLGVFIYFGTILVLIINIALNFKNNIYKNFWYIEMLAFAYCLFGGYYFIHSFIDDNNYLGIQQAVFWICGGMLYTHKREKKE